MGETEIIKTIVDYLKQNNVKEIGLFGSFARHEMTDESDIDVMVDYNRGTTLFDIVRMQQELSEKTGKKIDLVDKGSVLPKIMDYIKKDLQIVYHA